MIYAFNWALNGDGVTPLRGSAFRINKTLDLKVAGLDLPKVQPLKVNDYCSEPLLLPYKYSVVFLTPLSQLLLLSFKMKIKPADLSKIPEAGTDVLSFDAFDEVSQRTRDLLSLSDHLYCPEGHVPGTRTGVRVITNSSRLAPDLLAYLDRAPKKDPPDSLPITTYILEGNTEEDFAGYAIEEIEVALPRQDDGTGYTKVHVMPSTLTEARSVAAIVVVGKKPDIQVIVAGIEASQKALAADEVERAAKAAAAAAAKAEA